MGEQGSSELGSLIGMHKDDFVNNAMPEAD
jgi:hypothetical protein